MEPFFELADTKGFEWKVIYSDLDNGGWIIDVISMTRKKQQQP